MGATLDSELKQRLRTVLSQVGAERVTEGELRRLAEEGRACSLILSGQLAKREQALAALAADPASSLADIAAALRDVNQLRPDLAELNALLGDLQRRAREFRLAWVTR